MLISQVSDTIRTINPKLLSQKRRTVLNPLKRYVYQHFHAKRPILLNFICTHNSRRSQFAQVWAQTMASYFGIHGVVCYSGGTEVTRLHSQVANTLKEQGFIVSQLSEGENPIYAIKYREKELPIICFSKLYNDIFNPESGFGAIMTCDSANEQCPVVSGANERITVTYQDPKIADGTSEMKEIYFNKSLEIAGDMYYVFSKIARLF